MAWYTSWLPGLPSLNFAIPTSIQGRFISFVLKKSLGHFLKPGQLDYHQIDSQIGSGYVQVNELELSPEAINVYLDGLPIEMQEGSISSVKARIPWPNPLASTLGFSLKSVHLILRVVSPTNHPHPADIDLSDSVASVAEAFIHEELSPKEEATLWQSFHQDASANMDDHTIPGGLATSATAEGGIPKLDNDPAGVSVFAGLIESLLARFECDAEDIKVTLIHPDNVQITLSLQEMRYHTESKASPPDAPLAPGDVGGESRTLSLTGLSLFTTKGYQSSPIFPHRTTELPLRDSSSVFTSRPASRTSSSSSLDEETQFAMSQSLAALPPRSASPANSVSSSMYQSALSVTSSAMQQPRENVPQEDDFQEDVSEGTASAPASSQQLPQPFHEQSSHQEEMLLSFGSQPIIIKVTTPSPVNKGSEEDPFLTSAEMEHASDDKLHVTVSMNVLAGAVRPWQIQALLRLVDAVTSQNAPPQSPQPRATGLPPVTVNAHIRGFVLLLNSTSSVESNYHQIVADFFERPLVPPPADYGYTRLHLDTLSASATISPGEVIEAVFKYSIHFEGSITDVSIFSFTKSSQHGETVAFPLIITDPLLSSQYPSQHIQSESGLSYSTLPSFEIIDWADSKSFGTKLSQWRCRSPKSDTPLGSDTTPVPALQLHGHRTTSKSKTKPLKCHVTDDLGIRIAPLHIRVDLGIMLQPGSLLSFGEEILPLDKQANDGSLVSSQATVEDYPPFRRGVNSVVEEPETPFGEPIPNLGTLPHSRLTVDFPVVRLSLRCPPPPQYSNSRSGIVVVDLHDISLSTGSKPLKPSTRFARQDQSPTRNVDAPEESILVKAQFRRAMMACSAVGSNLATTFLSIGGLMDEAELKGDFSDFPPSSGASPLQPCIRVIKPNATAAQLVMALSIDVPAIHGDISKPLFDGLQYWADDISQFFDSMSRESTPNQEASRDSRDTSLIGSRFFAKSRSGSGSMLSNNTKETAESVVKLTITDTFVRISVPRSDEDLKSRPFDLKVSDLDLLLELNPDGKQQTILTLGILDLEVNNHARGDVPQRFLNLTSPHSLASAPKSILKLRFSTSSVRETNTKETRIKLTLCGFTHTFFPDLLWVSDVVAFVKNPPGTFESVIPSDRTRIFVKINDGSIRVFAPNHPGGLVSHMQDLEFSTDVVGDSRDSSFHVNASALAILALDDGARQDGSADSRRGLRGVSVWTASGYALIAEVADLDLFVVNQLNTSPMWKVDVHRINLRLHLCADSLTAVTALSSDLGSLGKSADYVPDPSTHGPAEVNPSRPDGSGLMSSIEDLTFKQVPEVGPAPDMIYDDLPTNLDYLDDSFGAAAGLREMTDEDLDEFDHDEITQSSGNDPNLVSRVGGETIKIFDPQGIDIVEDYFLTIPPETTHQSSDLTNASVSVRVFDGNFNLFLYDGYDWARTRKTIEEEVKEMRKRLAKIRQLVANGHMQDPSLEDTSALLYNSVHIGLDDDEDALGEPAALIAAIDKELKEDSDTNSWQSLPTFTPGKPRVPHVRVHGKRLTRSRGPSMEFCLKGLHAEVDQFQPDDPLVSRTFVTVRDLEILDHIKTSTWKKFLTELRSDSKGNVRETDSDMVRIELRAVQPVPGQSSEEMRLKAKILPLRLYVDQDAVDFLKKFFSFKDPHATPTPETSDSQDAYIQLAEIFPIDLKLDYKPRRVDYRALREGKTIELMNFFHFDGAEMTLRHITLAGVTGWPRLFEMLNDLWTPDVKATQLAEVISGVAPIRSMVNVGSGVADLILLPIAQYKKDGRIVRGVQKGATAFAKSTGMEAIRLGARLATGTQVILEQAEGLFGGQFEAPVTAEPFQGDDFDFENEEVDDETADLISKYAQQPVDIKEGVQSAYKSLQRNLSSAAQTILAVPMEVYERSGNEGPVRSVIRAVPIAVLRPMIGASEAVSKTLLGLHNTLDPNVRHENEAKYKLR